MLFLFYSLVISLGFLSLFHFRHNFHFIYYLDFFYYSYWLLFSVVFYFLILEKNFPSSITSYNLYYFSMFLHVLFIYFFIFSTLYALITSFKV